MAIVPAAHLCINLRCYPPFAASKPPKVACPIFRFPAPKTSLSQSSYHHSSNSVKGTYDPELRSVLELATDTELYDLQRILFGPSYFSPLLKAGMGGANVDYTCIGADMEERDDFISVLESRFLFLAADARSTLRWTGTYDPELRSVLELATDSELYDLQRILFGPSYFSPLFKAAMGGANVDYTCIGVDMEERDDFISVLESRFLFLAADARSTLRGWRPLYRNVLLGVTNKLNIPCSKKLTTEALEVEIYLHLFQEYSGSEIGVSQWKMQAVALKAWAPELRSSVLKGGGMFTLGKLYKLITSRLSGKMLLEASKYQAKNEILKKGGQLAALSLESRVAVHVAKQGFVKAVSRYMGLRSMVMLFGPMLWGTFLADVVIQMLGTDYSRILRAICAIAEIRISRNHKL